MNLLKNNDVENTMCPKDTLLCFLVLTEWMKRRDNLHPKYLDIIYRKISKTNKHISTWHPHIYNKDFWFWLILESELQVPLGRAVSSTPPSSGPGAGQHTLRPPPPAHHTQLSAPCRSALHTTSPRSAAGHEHPKRKWRSQMKGMKKKPFRKGQGASYWKLLLHTLWCWGNRP